METLEDLCEELPGFEVNQHDAQAHMPSRIFEAGCRVAAWSDGITLEVIVVEPEVHGHWLAVLYHDGREKDHFATHDGDRVRALLVETLEADSRGEDPEAFVVPEGWEE